LKLIWGSFIVEIIILSLIKPFITDFDAVAIITVLIHVMFSMIILMGYKDKLNMVFLGAYLTRVLFMLWDLYARNIYMLPNSGSDSEAFYQQSLNFSKSISTLIHGSGELYSKVIGLIFYWIGPGRMFGQYINVLLGLSIVVIIYKILSMLDIKDHIRIIVILVAAFFPNSMILSSIFLREIFPTFFVTASLYYFIKWYKTARYTHMLLSFVMIGLASMFHSGVIGIIVGYSFAFLFYKKEEMSFQITRRTGITFILISAAAIFGFIMFGDLILVKMKALDNINDIYSAANTRFGGSAYLSGLKIDSPIQLVLFGSLKSIYFLTSPLPMNWRGVTDIVTFFMDSLMYLGIIVYFLKNRPKYADRRALMISLIVCIIGAALIFGIGVSNAGTAMRHRQKLIPIFLVLLAVIMDEKQIFFNKRKLQNTINQET
jgi:hypothetical protein